MRLYEFQAKKIFKDNGIPVPKGKLATCASEVEEIAKQIGGAVVVKAQALVGRRGLAGGVRFADNSKEAGKVAEEILGSRIKCEEVQRVLVEEKIPVKEEFYIGITIDHDAGLPTVMVTSKGGIEIEILTKRFPEKLVKKTVDVFRGLPAYEAISMAKKIGLNNGRAVSFSSAIRNLYGIFENYDAELVEINPFALTMKEEFIAVDAKLSLDDRAKFRHEGLVRDLEDENPKPKEGSSYREYLAKKAGISSYVEFDGNIGIISDGAGTALLTLDLTRDYGGGPADFCELGGMINAEMMKNALEIVTSNQNVKVMLVTLIGGLTRMDEMAEGIARFLEGKSKVPIVVRLAGTLEEEGKRILKRIGVDSSSDMYASIRKAVKLARGI